MNRLTEKDERGNWRLKGIPWESLREGQVITKEVCEKLYGALCKLKDYEDTRLSPQDVERVNSFERSQTEKLLKRLNEEERKHRWIPVEERFPDTDDYILISFENFSIPAIGRYEVDEEGGAFYVGNDDLTCANDDLFANAWMPLPELYHSGERV